MKSFKEQIKPEGFSLITGASSGIGAEYARQLAMSGSNLLLVSNQEEQLRNLSELLSTEYGIKTDWIYQDLSAEDSAQKIFDYCEDKGYRVDILINNAGMFFFKELNQNTINQANTMLRLHIYTPTQLCTLFGNEMKKRGHGYILNMSSMAAKMPMPGITVYSATKSYIKSFSKSLYYEMKPYNVHVTTICPGAVDTPLYNLNKKYNQLMKKAVKIRFVYSTKLLVNKALKALFRKRRCTTPGLMNSVWPFVVNSIPNSLVNKIWVRVR